MYLINKNKNKNKSKNKNRNEIIIKLRIERTSKMRRYLYFIIFIVFSLVFLLSCGKEDIFDSSNKDPIVISGRGGNAKGSLVSSISTYLGMYSSGCFKTDKEHESQIMVIEISYDKILTSILDYTYEGDNPTCSESDIYQKRQILESYRITGEYNGGAVIELDALSYKITSLSDAKTEEFNSLENNEGQVVGYCGLRDWVTGQTKEFSLQNQVHSIVVKRIGNSLYQNNEFDNDGNRLDPQDGDGPFIKID